LLRGRCLSAVDRR